MVDLYELKQLTAFAELGTLSRVAEAFHLSTPSVTRSMQHLERYFGVPLFTRGKNRIELNDTGRLAVSHARKLLAAAEDAVDKLILLNHELYVMIESSISIDLLTRLLSTQLLARGEKHLLDRDRVYFKMLRQIIRTGQEKGQLRRDLSVNEILKAFALWERAQLYDWCLCSGEYSLVSYAARTTPMFLESYRGGHETGEKIF